MYTQCETFFSFFSFTDLYLFNQSYFHQESSCILTLLSLALSVIIISLSLHTINCKKFMIKKIKNILKHFKNKILQYSRSSYFIYFIHLFTHLFIYKNNNSNNTETLISKIKIINLSLTLNAN